MKLLQQLKRFSRQFHRKSGIELKIDFLENGERIQYDLSVFGINKLEHPETAELLSQILRQLPGNVQSMLQEYDLSAGEIRKNEATNPNSKKN